MGLHKDEKLTLEEQDIEEDHRNLGGESLDTGSCARDSLSGRTLQTRRFGSELSSFLRKVRFSNQEFTAGIPVSNIKYNHPIFQNNNLFYPFYN